MSRTKPRFLKRHRLLLASSIFTIAALILAGVITHKKVYAPAPKPTPPTSIVQFENDQAKQQFQQQNNLSPDQLEPTGGNTYLVPKKSDELKATPGSSTQPNYIYHALLTPNDPLGTQWYTTRISAPTAWDTTTGLSSVTVAVLDTGFGLSHQDMGGRWAINSGEQGTTSVSDTCWTGVAQNKQANNCDDDGDGKIDNWRGWDFVHGDNDPSAGSTNPNGGSVYHGTVTSGLVGATGNNSVGTASLNWGAKILPLQVLDDNGIGDTIQIVAAVNYAVAQGAKIISMSLGQTVPDTVLQTAVDNAVNNGVAIVAAAGNCGGATWSANGCDYEGQMVYPGNYPEVITVGATDINDNQAAFSSHGANLDVTAPGYASGNGSDRIYTPFWTNGNQTTSYTQSVAGTSISTPIVAGLAAMIKGQFPSATPVQIEQWIKNGADRVSGMNGLGRTDNYGYGRINAASTLQLYSWSPVSQQAYTDNTKTTPVDLSKLSPGQTAWLTLTAKNTGNITWNKAGANPVHLGTEGPIDRNSRYATGAWLNPARPAALNETTVAPDTNGTFEFPIQVPAGNFTGFERFNLVAEGITWMHDQGLSYYNNVGGNYSWSYISEGAWTDNTKATPVDVSWLSPGQRVFFSITARNTGNATWYKTGPYPVHLGTNRPIDRTSQFYDAGWLSTARIAAFNEASVAPGANGTFEGYFDTPALPTSTPEYLNLVAESITWMNDIAANYPGVVPAYNYSWSFVTQYYYTDATKTTPVDINNLAAGQVFYYGVVAKNTGTATWYNSGGFPTRLGTSRPMDHVSGPDYLYHSSWVQASRPALLKESEVKPDQNGTFEAYFTAPATIGLHKEYFQPVTDLVTWMNDIGLHIPVNVTH